MRENSDGLKSEREIIMSRKALLVVFYIFSFIFKAYTEIFLTVSCQGEKN